MKIGDLRRKLFLPVDCAWNGYVRDLTAKFEMCDELVDESVIYEQIIAKCAALVNFEDFRKNLFVGGTTIEQQLYEAYLLGCEDECIPDPKTFSEFIESFARGQK